jgi:hypothetical protein
VGLGSDTIELLIRLRRDGYVGGRGAMIEIGAQQLSSDFLAASDALARIARSFAVSSPSPLPPPQPTRLAHGVLEHLPDDAPPARDFWTWLGFDYAAVDIDGTPDSIPLDLNYDSVPAEALGGYRLVTNFGTTEHVANQLNAFKVIHDLTAQGGLMLHAVPMQGMLNHGLVNYTPKFFGMLARSNNYRLVYLNIGAAGDYGLPDHIAADVARFEPDIEQRRQSLRQSDGYIVAALQKTFDTPYVPPIDVATGAGTTDRVLEERYWSVFKPNAFRYVRAAYPSWKQPWTSLIVAAHNMRIVLRNRLAAVGNRTPAYRRNR